jgi:hypothetical protein
MARSSECECPFCHRLGRTRVFPNSDSSLIYCSKCQVYTDMATYDYAKLLIKFPLPAGVTENSATLLLSCDGGALFRRLINLVRKPVCRGIFYTDDVGKKALHHIERVSCIQSETSLTFKYVGEQIVQKASRHETVFCIAGKAYRVGNEVRTKQLL